MADTERTEVPRNEDAIWLEVLADEIVEKKDLLQATGHDTERIDRIANRLRAIALGCDELALMKKRENELEGRIDAALCETLELWLECDEPQEDNTCIVAGAVWLLGRRMRTAGTMHAIGGGLGALGLAMLGGSTSSRGGTCRDR